MGNQDSDIATLQIRPYAYTALDRNVGDIRLLRLLPAASPTQPVYCRLSHAPLEDTTKTIYEALSYTWGKDGRTETIRLDDQDFAVTANLREALLALRDPHSTRVLWIDAICINQDDVEERAHEVVRMLRIYQLASRVVVWLGSSSDNSELAIQHFHELHLEWQSHRNPALRAKLTRLAKSVCVKAVGCIMGLVLALRYRYLISSWNILFLMGWLPFGTSGITCLLVRLMSAWTLLEMAVTIWGGYLSLSTDLAHPKGQPSPETIQALAAFHARSWFRRAWVIQEIAAAQDLIMVCGSEQMHVLIFLNATHAIDSQIADTSVRSTYVDSGYMRGGALRTIVNRAAIGSLRRIGGGHIGTSQTEAERLLILLQKFRYADATDERDNIYAILGLCNFDPLAKEHEVQAKSLAVVPSYTQPAWRVYASSVRALIAGTNGSLDVLRHCEGFRKVPGLPSWAPDWTCRNVSVPISTMLTLKAMSFDLLLSP
ncbi:HET domain-containing protein [Microdochium nivale]|nr:HET domain-containing protein [Microdochium nivale]